MYMQARIRHDLSTSSPDWQIQQGVIAVTIDSAVLRFAGFMVLVSVALGYWVSPYWYWLTVFVGVNLIQSSFTGFCPAAIMFKRLGCRPGLAFN
jgi:hypothetical protein